MLQLSWLGPPAADVDGSPIHFETRKVTALLAYLSLNTVGNPREKLAALFWPEFDPVHALANLRRALSSLTRSLPAGYIEADREIIRWNELLPLEMDVRTFQEGILPVRSHAHQEAAVCPSCFAALELAANCYRGDFLDGLNLPDCPAFDEWQYLTRQELKRDLAWSLERLAASLAARSDWERAATMARRWISLDRLEVLPQVSLAGIYARAGQRGMAQRQEDEYARLFKEEFGEELDDDTRELFRRAIDQGQPHRNDVKTAPIRQPAASQILLKTKLYLPKVKPSRVSRPRLHLKLNQVCRYSLSLVSAPAGFGKTSLLAEWAAQAAEPVGWLSLDALDNDPSRFLSYLCAALDGLQDDIAGNARLLLEAIPPVPPQTVLQVLLKDLERVTEPLVLVLDDYQFITNQAVHELVIYLLGRASENLHLVIAARADPPLPLARLRADGELLELRTDDLRFTLEECVIFFDQVMGLQVAREDVQTLAARTEGWAVGLQMAAISLQGTPDRTKFIQTFSGSHRFILEYLIQEVLDRQPEPVRDFLLKTSILDRLCSELCEAVAGTQQAAAGAAALLDNLERSNLFLVPLDQEQHWYRYHHLFADLLNSQLQRFQPAVIPELHLRACSWYEMNGQIDSAIEHALAAGDFERVGDLVEKDAQRLAYRVDFARLQRWIDKLPPEMVIRRAWIAITQGWLWLVAGKQPLLAGWMDQLDESYHTLWANRYSENERRDQLANMLSLRAYMAFFAGDMPESIALARQALQVITPSNDVLRVRLLVQLGEAYLIVQDLPIACDFLAQGIELGISIQDFQSTTTASMRLFKALRLLGRLNQAAEMIQKVIGALSERGRLHTPIASKPELCWGDLLRERGQWEAAGEWLDWGLQHARQYTLPYDVIAAIVYKVKWLAGKRLWDQALHLLDEGLPLLKNYSIPPSIAFSWVLWQANVCLEKGDLQAAEAWIERLSLDIAEASMYLQDEAYLTLARLHQRKGEHNDALAVLDRVASDVEAGSRYGSLIPILISQAESLAALGSREPALDRLEKCLALAQPEGYLATFLDEGPPVPALLQALQSRNLPEPFSAYIEALIKAFEQNWKEEPVL